jgi:hypothetical protein
MAMFRVLIAWIVLVSAATAAWGGTMRASLPVSDDRCAEDSANFAQGWLLDGVFELQYPADDVYLNVVNDRWLELRSAMEFDLGVLPSGRPIVGAILTVHLGGRTPNPLDLSVYGYAGSGEIDSAVYGANRLLETRTLDGIPENWTQSFDVTSLVTELQQVNASHTGFAFRTSNGSAVNIVSIEAPWRDDWHPELIVEYVPEPSTLGLAMAGAAALGMRWRRGRNGRSLVPLDRVD